MDEGRHYASPHAAFGLIKPPKTSSSKSLTPRASARDGTGATPSRSYSTRSASVSSASTVDDDGGSSPVLPPLPAPKLPGRASEYLRTPPSNRSSEADRQYVTASWGSPYPEADSDQFRRLSFSSETSEESPLHQLEINTPFLRPAPLIATTEPDLPPSSLTGSAAVLANRARRPIRGITEDWIRQHTTNNLASEHRLWLSDTDDSEPSSLRSSVSGDEASWSEEADLRTPRATLHPFRASSKASQRHPRERSSNETLRQAVLNRRVASKTSSLASMDALDVERGGQDAVSIHTIESASETAQRVDTPRSDQPSSNGSMQNAPFEAPTTPVKSVKPVAGKTPRPKKKMPWRGKNILVCLPWDEERGQPGKAPKPLSAGDVTAMYRSWEELGYSVRGFDLEGQHVSPDPLENYSQSRGEWPIPEDLVKERSQRKYQVTLPDLNAWKNYADEVQEAKLRALGVSFGEDEPAPPPSISPAASNMSRQASNQYPSMPFSPPLPTPSAASNGQPFPFPPPFLSGQGSSATQSPGVPSAASPASFNGPPLHGKFNPRASISISPNEHPFNFSGQASPHAWSPQMLLHQQHGHRSGSPSLFNLNSMVSPQSPFQRDGLNSPAGVHQRHQSLQYPTLPHQYLHRSDSARASPRLQDLREVEEETQSNPYEENKSPSKTPEPNQFIRHNASDSLQKEIDDAEYHLEEQFRSQLEHEDYSPHNEYEKIEGEKPAEAEAPSASHTRGPSVHFGNFGTDSDEGPKLHHPQPHSRGHSLSQAPYYDDEARNGTEDGGFKKHRPADLNLQNGDNSYEIETNPSNLGTPIQAFDLVNQLHQRSLSTASNPWADSQPLSGSKSSSRRHSHASKPSLSKLNAGAAEFKFNPASSFTPSQSSQFVFGSNNNAQPSSFQPTPFQAPSFTPNPRSATSSHFSMNSTSSASKLKINASAPAFSPRKGEFSFSGFGPKFNPDAPAFQPMHSFASSVASTGASGNENTDNRPGSIFGNIDLNVSGVVKPAKKSKAVPIVRPSSSHSPAPGRETTEDRDGRVTDSSRTKKQFRESNDDGDDVPLFAEPTPEPEAAPPAQQQDSAVSEAAESETEDALVEESVHVGDTTFASTILSESTDGKLHSESNDTKTTTSPSATSPDQDKSSWKPFEPFGDDEPSFPFVPGGTGGFAFGTSDAIAASFEPVLKTQPDDRAGSPTPGPDFKPSTEVEAEPAPEVQAAPSEEDVPAPPPRGLGLSRFASPPPAPKGLKASRFATTPSPPPKSAGLSVSHYAASPSPVEVSELHSFEPLPVNEVTHELTFEEIDARTMESPKWRQPSPVRDVPADAVTNSPPVNLPPKQGVVPRPSTELDDPFVDPPRIHRLNIGDSLPGSDWDDAFSDGEQVKLEQRVRYFDGQVHDLVGSLLASRLGPVEKALGSIQHALGGLARRTPSSRRDRRSTPKMDQIRIAVMDALNQQQTMRALQAAQLESFDEPLEQMKEELNLRNVVEEAPLSEMQSKILDLERRLRVEEGRTESERSREARGENETTIRRGAEDRAAELRRQLEQAETKVEVEIMNRSNEIEISEIQRLLRISSEEEDRLRAVLEERDQKTSMRLALLEAAQTNAEQTQAELKNRLNISEVELRDARQEARHWPHRQADDLVEAINENKHMHKLIDTLGVQLEENERIRDNWRAKFITEENSRRTKKEQAFLAPEARTRERLEAELERAVGDCKRLEGLLSELKTENHNLQQNALRYQREIQDARDSAASELEASNNQVNVLRAQLDQMMLEEAQTSKQIELEEAENQRQSELSELIQKHQNEIEDLQARYERQIHNTTEDAQRTEQNLLERLSLSTSKTEHLQDRVAHLEDKVQIAQEAAKAAAQAAAQASKSMIVPSLSSQPGPVAQTKQLGEAMQLPEKVSPQALRESIMVLQEQLQAREQQIEELEQTVSKLDPDSATKISKRDDEITWLRELLAVRHGDLQDIINALSMDHVDREVIKDAAIRLKANLQMEEQERERAMNGGSAINLPNIAATIRGAATPRVAQAVGPLAAAWGSWRKSNQSLSSVLASSPASARNSTPSKINNASQSGLLSGLMTPPASGIRNTPPVQQSQSQPTAFGNTGRRFTAEEFANRTRGPSMTARQAEKMPRTSTPPQQQERRQPVTPPMMRTNAYDEDARVEEFDDASFFDD
ncbi:hypothetical protein F4819DRAFT_496538 [Hypoxylon fuscum]|nr:hypothetical protein F4819DRAFT_496538 [Hypoxylon fuscum]